MVLNIPRNLWEELVDAYYGKEPSFWDCYPRVAPCTLVDLDNEVIDDHDEGIENSSTLHLCIYLTDRILYRCC